MQIISYTYTETKAESTESDNSKMELKRQLPEWPISQCATVRSLVVSEYKSLTLLVILQSLNNLGYFAYAQTVNTRPLLEREGIGTRLETT